MNDFPLAVVLCLVRDGREVALSLRSMPWFAGDLAGSAQEWLKAARLLHFFKKTYPKRFWVVCYEDLIAMPSETLSAVMAYLDLGFQSTQLCPDAPSEMVVPRSLAWKGRALAAVDATLVSSRRSAADPEEIRFLNEVLGDELSRLDYEIS